MKIISLSNCYCQFSVYYMFSWWPYYSLAARSLMN